MFGRRWGARAEALREEVRAKLASNAHERALLTDAITKLESTLSGELAHRAQLESSTEAAVDSLRASVAEHSTDLAAAVEEIARMCALLAERIEIERDERRALVEAVTMLARQTMEQRPALELGEREERSEPGVIKPRLVGGNVYASTSDDAEIVLVDETANGQDRMSRLAMGAAVRCRFGDGWIEGLEVCEVVGDGADVRYRIRRVVDQYVLPARFDRIDLELVGDSSPPNARGRWWQS